MSLTLRTLVVLTVVNLLIAQIYFPNLSSSRVEPTSDDRDLSFQDATKSQPEATTTVPVRSDERIERLIRFEQEFKIRQSSTCLSSSPSSSPAKSHGDPFPHAFDLDFYRRANKNDTLTEEHYRTTGRKEGWRASRGQSKFVSTIAESFAPSKVLEIGPFVLPAIRSSNVEYFDVLTLEGLIERAEHVGYPTDNPPHKIHYIHPTGDLRLGIPANQIFGMVYSQHVIEHQLDLIDHLQAVESLLEPSGFYVMTVPDHRYCFDLFLAPTNIAQVLEDHYNNLDYGRQQPSGRAKQHKLQSVVEHRTLIALPHFPKLQWEGWKPASPEPNDPNFLKRIKNTITEYRTSLQIQKYLDVHNYKFTPENLEFILTVLYHSGLTNMRVHRVYPTVRNVLEFSVVLQKCKTDVP